MSASAGSAASAEEPVASLRILGGRRVAGLNPEERPVETRVGLRPEELAVEVDADLEARVTGHDLNSGRATDRMADDPHVLQIEMPSQRRARLESRQPVELVEYEPVVGGADVDQALERRMRRRSHHVRMSRLADNPAVGKDRDR